MTDRTTAREAREALDELHLAAHENGPTSDLSTHFRRARRLWVAMGGEHRMAYGDPIPAWDDLGAHMQLMLAGLVARAVQDVLEVEQVMYRALSAALELHRPVDEEVIPWDCAEGDCDHEDDEHPLDTVTLCEECYRLAAEVSPYYGENGCSAVLWPCPTAATITAALAGVEGEG